MRAGSKAGLEEAIMGDTGVWAVLFGLGGIAVVALALILMRQKVNQAELWKQDPENPRPRFRQGSGEDAGSGSADSHIGDEHGSPEAGAGGVDEADDSGSDGGSYDGGPEGEGR